MQAQLVNYVPKFEENRELMNSFTHTYVQTEKMTSRPRKKKNFSVRLMKLGANFFPS
jgi:hypothetical protein